MSFQEVTAKKVVVTAALAVFAIGASLVAQTGSGTRTVPASRPTASGVTSAAPSASADAAKYRALVNKYCVACHNARTANPAEGPVNLEGAAFDDLVGHAATWERVLRKLSVRAMPPPGTPEHEEWLIDEAGDESFPASDSPAPAAGNSAGGNWPAPPSEKDPKKK